MSGLPTLLPFGEPLLAAKSNKHKRVLYDKQDGRCYYCGDILGGFITGVTGARATVDHIVPRAAGGANALDNKVLACEWCNSAKGDTWPYDPYYTAQALWAAGGDRWQDLTVMGAKYRLHQFRAAAAALGEQDVKNELNELPVGTVAVKTKRGWTISLCNTHTNFERVAVKAATFEEGLLAMKDALKKYLEAVANATA